MRLHTIITKAAAIAGIAVVGIAMAATYAVAQTEGSSSQNMTFPISELGNCADQNACHAYCNVAAHMQACTTFAQNHGLESAGDAHKAEQFAQLLAQGAGPGGCNSPDACDAYCTTISHLNTCVAFAKAHNFTDQNLAQGERVATYLQSGGHTPGNCTSKDTCEAYCQDQSHQQECMQFAQAVGMQGGMGGSDHGQQTSPEMQQKFSALLQSGKTPGGCTTLQACETYCSDPSHGSACGDFGAAMGGVQGNQRVTQPGPGGCTSDATCKAYCADPTHAQECAQFAHQSNYKENVQSPGGCTSDATCKAYCADPAHAQECAQFSHQSNYVQGNDKGYGLPEGQRCGSDQYFNGTVCVQSGAPCQAGSPCVPPSCPPGQTCNTDLQQGGQMPPQGQSPMPGPSSSTDQQQGNVLGIFGGFLKSVEQTLLGH